MRVYNFRDVVGNTETVTLIQKSLVKNTLRHFVIFSGVPGVGKSTCAETAGLYLTCEHPENGEPCLKCSTCKTNINALQTTGKSMNLIKFNLGLRNTKQDMQELVKEIFILKGGVGSSVYILEEPQALNSNEQTSLLEEIDRLDSNTFIFMSTTKLYKLLPELRSRAIIYNFNRLNKTESRLLFDKTCARLGVSKISESTMRKIMDYSKGIARDATNLIEYIYTTQPTEEQIASFLGVINFSSFTNLFVSMKADMRTMVDNIEYLLSKHTYDVIIDQLKEYVLEVVFYLEGDIKDSIAKEDREAISSIFAGENTYKISSIVEKLNPRESTETDLKFALLKIRQLVNNKKLVDIYNDNIRSASAQNVGANTMREDLIKSKQDSSSNVGNASLKFSNFFGDTK